MARGIGLAARQRTGSRIGTVTGAIVLCLSMIACGSSNNDGSTPTVEIQPTATMQPDNAISEPLEIAGPIWATSVNPSDGSPADRVEWFPTNAEAIYAVFETSAIRAGTSFTISWTMNGTPVPGLNPTLQMTADAPAGWIEFHLTRTSPTPWPDGQLEVQLRVGEDVVSSGSIELRDQ